jgi:hypothetical protein
MRWVVGGADGRRDLVEANVSAGVGGVDHPSVAERDPDVVDRLGSGTEEHQITRLRRGVCRQVRRRVVLLLGGARQCQPGAGVGELHQT